MLHNDDEIIEVHTSIENDGLIRFFKWDDKEGKAAFWHSTAHVLAQVILEIYPHSKLTIGPAIESGFYYDVDFGVHNFSENDFEEIEKEFWKFQKKIMSLNLENYQKKTL